jgi:hypothetical protein
MKKLNIMLLVTLICLCVTSTALAVDYADYVVSADIPDYTPEITVVMRELTSPDDEPSAGGIVQSMNFGQLRHDLVGGGDAGVWYSNKYYCAFIYTGSWGHRYEIRSSCPGLSDTAQGLSLPAGSFMLKPDYKGVDLWTEGDPTSAQDDDNVPPGELGTVGSAVTGSSYAVLYTSEAAASNRIIRAFYSLPGYAAGGADPYEGYDPILLTQLGGNYQGTVTITIAAQ